MAQKEAEHKQAQLKRKREEPEEQGKSSEPQPKKSRRTARIINDGAASPGLRMKIRLDTPKKESGWKIERKEEPKNECKKPLVPPPKLPLQLARMIKEDQSEPSTPKVAVNQAKNMHFKPPTPSSSTGSPDYGQATFSYLDLLTPVTTPNEEVDFDPTDSIISTIINWDAIKIMDPQFRTKAFYTNLTNVPDKSFGDRSNYEKCVHFLISFLCSHSLLHKHLGRQKYQMIRTLTENNAKEHINMN